MISELRNSTAHDRYNSKASVIGVYGSTELADGWLQHFGVVIMHGLYSFRALEKHL